MAFFPERLQTTKELITREGTVIAAGNNVNLGASSFLRLTSGTSLTGLAGGLSGYEVTLINATGATVTIAHNSASSSAGNKIATESSADRPLVNGAAMLLKYSANLFAGAGGWQVVSVLTGAQLPEGTAIAAGNDVSLALADFVRITSGTSLTGLAGGISGYQLTLINATAGDVTIANNSGSSSAGNKIVTGTGGDIALPSGAALYLKWSANLLTGGAWQVVGGVAGGFKTSAVQTLGAGGTPTIGTQPFQRIKVKSSGGPLSMATTLAGGTDGMTILFIGDDSTNTITIAQNDAANGWILNGDVVLSKYSTLLVQYDSSGTGRWIEISRNMIASYV
jgi:hypothetical protein